MRTFCALLLFVLSVTYLSCKKNDQVHQIKNLAPEKPLISKAHSYFQKQFGDAGKNIKGNHSPAQALWNKAYTKGFSIGDVVIVPLNWGENSFIKSKISGEEKISANKISYLLMYKDEKDLFHTEIVYSIADSTSSQRSGSFSGLIAVTDWNGNTLKLFRYKNGKEIFLQSDRHVTAKEAVFCYDIDWYYCTSEFGCRYSYTQTVCGLADDGTGNGNGTSYYGPTSGDYSNSGHSGGSGSSGTDNITLDPAYLYNGLGGKPILEYSSSNRCQGFQNMWNNYINNEVFGYITADGKLIVTDLVPFSGGQAKGLYTYHNSATKQDEYYYIYPTSQGAPLQSYTGMKNNGSYYFIPIVASIHTHTPCRTDGTDGVSQTVSDDDHDLAVQHPGLRHWVIGCNAIARFDNTNYDFFDVQTVPISSTCAIIN